MKMPNNMTSNKKVPKRKKVSTADRDVDVESSSSCGQEKEISSFSIFSSFIKVDENGKCDATGVLERDCYIAWINSRKFIPKNPHEAFRRAVTAHIRGNDGRRPFSEEAETSLLKELRKKQQWKAFEGTDLLVGIKGFSSLGHHEKRRLFKKSNGQENVDNIKKENTTTSEKASKKRSRTSKNTPASTPTKRPKFEDITESTMNSLKFQLPEPETDHLLRYLKQETNAANATVPDSLVETYPKSCTHDYLFSHNLENFDPWLDEMLDIGSETLDGVEYPNVFENPRYLEIMY